MENKIINILNIIKKIFIKKFPCDKCGECCRIVGCGFITSDNLCSIYKDRPLICRVDEYYEKKLKHRYTKKEFYALNKQICKIFQKAKNEKQAGGFK